MNRHLFVRASTQMATSVVGVMLFAACDTNSKQPSATLSLMSGVASSDSVCFAVQVRDEAGRVVFERGVPGAKPATLDEALAGGAVCGAEDVQVDARCELGPSEARAWLVGFYAGGLRLEETYHDPCGDAGCAKTFECLEVDNPVVEFDMTLMRVSQQGFFDVSVLSADAPEGAQGICYALRVTNGEGVEVLSVRSLCSHDYGNGRGGDISYIVPCDAASPENEVTVWVHPLDGATDASESPCPAPASGALETWTGGCSKTYTCVENQDVTVHFDFESGSR